MAFMRSLQSSLLSSMTEGGGIKQFWGKVKRQCWRSNPQHSWRPSIDWPRQSRYPEWPLQRCLHLREPQHHSNPRPLYLPQHAEHQFNHSWYPQAARELKTTGPDAAGPDALQPRLLRDLAPQLVSPICIMFQQFYDTGTIPQARRDALASPVHKKGSKHNPGKLPASIPHIYHM